MENFSANPSDIKKIGVDKIKSEVSDFIKYEETLLSKFGYSFLRKIIAPIIRGIWVDEVEGLHNFPKEGSALVALNHSSYFDFLTFGSVSPRKIHFLAAEKLFKAPHWRVLMELSGQIRVDRNNPDKSKTFAHVFSALEQGRVVGIFPEGTRSADGKIQKPFNGVAKIALKAKVPVVPVGLIGTYEIMSRSDNMPKLKKAKIKIGAPHHFKEYHDIDHTDEHYEIVTERVMLSVASLAGKEYPHLKHHIIENGEAKLKKNV